MNDKMSITAILLTIVVLFFVAIGLSGCSRQPEYKVIYKTKIVVEKPPAAIINTNIETPRPPNKFTYVNSNPFARETLLTNYVIDLLKTIKKYKIYQKAINEWYEKTIQNATEVNKHNTTDGK